jgi:pimeloyl-ACP methyl ester carboxylesterase
MNSIQKTLPFYFRRSDKPLFGCYHEPPTNRRRQVGVLICQPVGHEYVNSHRALRQLANRFSEAGFPVLRFDYYGCGDSSGSTEDSSVAQWLKDISAAIAELRQRAGVFRVCLVGLRLGAALAALAAAQRRDVESMVLWDPVVEGGRYFADLCLLEKEMLRFRPKRRRTERATDGLEILGFPWPHFLISEVESINLRTIAGGFAKNMLVMQSDLARVGDCLADQLGLCATHLERRSLEAPEIWRPTVDGSLLVPAQVLQAVVSWSSEIHS